MAYGNYFNYQQPYFQNYQPQMTSNTQSSQNSGILWVQGEAGAKSYMVAPGQSVMLMDSETNTFYIKSSDMSGMPMPLRVFDYTERKSDEKSEVKKEITPNLEDYITRTEFEKRLAEMKGEKINNESSI